MKNVICLCAVVVAVSLAASDAYAKKCCAKVRATKCCQTSCNTCQVAAPAPAPCCQTASNCCKQRDTCQAKPCCNAAPACAVATTCTVTAPMAAKPYEEVKAPEAPAPAPAPAPAAEEKN